MQGLTVQAATNLFNRQGSEKYSYGIVVSGVVNSLFSYQSSQGSNMFKK